MPDEERPTPDERDEKLKIDLDPETALRGLLKVDPEADTVYVPLTGEAVDVHRPVPASRKSDNTYRLIGESPEGESWAFSPGSLVRCEWQTLDGERVLVAVAAA